MKTRSLIICLILAVGVGFALALWPSLTSVETIIDAPEVTTPSSDPSVPSIERNETKSLAKNPDKSGQESWASQLDLAESGDAQAQFDVGVAFLDGVGVDQDRQAGLEWLRRASENGHKTAGYILAELANDEQ